MNEIIIIIILTSIVIIHHILFYIKIKNNKDYIKTYIEYDDIDAALKTADETFQFLMINLISNTIVLNIIILTGNTDFVLIGILMIILAIINYINLTETKKLILKLL
ncbi:hypothetical protein Phi14:2_gp010 [Cellulophaga phage phi14:2]|uniref:DUF3784 domain-containing protein n=1 Tax=Cellulophaga phage phi14:2 TaxID=1327990 RepID=S0A3S4_9CAUD|nr:hypothetical protein Phi14:2_gp010 [Cellulophaga phage phi14:2]